MVQMIDAKEARVNITWQGQNGDMPQPVYFDSGDVDIRRWVTEAVRNGGVPGILADAHADFRACVVDRFRASDTRPYNLIQIRPTTPFG